MNKRLEPAKSDRTYYTLSSHIYITQFRDQVILLDTKKNKYTICSANFGNILLKIVINQEPQESEQDHLNVLLQSKIIQRKKTPYFFYTDCKPESDGVSNIDWRLPLNEEKIPLNLTITNALRCLIKVNFYIKFLGFYQAIRLIQKARKKHVHYIIPSDEDLRRLAYIVNKTCLIYPCRTKCLEWAMTYVLLALQKSWKCNLEVGVQNYPFMAHAWVECNEKVVMDSPEIRERLGIILNEPFRKENV